MPVSSFLLMHLGFHVFPFGVSCFPCSACAFYLGFMLSLLGFHVFPSMFVAGRYLEDYFSGFHVSPLGVSCFPKHVCSRAIPRRLLEHVILNVQAFQILRQDQQTRHLNHWGQYSKLYRAQRSMERCTFICFLDMPPPSHAANDCRGPRFST